MMLDRAVLDAPLLDPADLDLEAAERVTYVLEQRMHYTYDAPIDSLRHRLMVLPPRWHGDQHRRGYRLDISGADVRRTTRLDARGNVVVRVSADVVETGVDFRLAALVERGRIEPGRTERAPVRADVRLLRPTRLTRPDARLTQLAHDSVRGLTDPMERVLALNRTVHGALTYEYGITSVSTTAAAAVAGGKGVCQDSAHIMLALCHALADPGALRVRPPDRPGRHACLGRGARAGRRADHARPRPVQRPGRRSALPHYRDRPRLRRRRPHLGQLRGRRPQPPRIIPPARGPRRRLTASRRMGA